MMQSRGVATAQELAAGLGVDRSSVSRGLGALGGAVCRIGAARSARYALRRTVRNLGSRWSLHRIDDRGHAHELGVLHALHGGFLWATREATPMWLRHGYTEGIFPGLPFFLSDMRPQGFLGRATARAVGLTLGVPVDPRDWQDDDILAYLLNHGSDTPGDLVVGDAMLTAVLAAQQRPSRTPIAADARGEAYAALATEAMQGGTTGSSAGGEQPKFTATVREPDGSPRAVLVKFSPPMDTPSGRRWADLLVAEWHALRLLAERGHAAAPAELLDGGGRRFLEVMRYDRAGATGRRGVLTLQAVEAGLLDGSAADWPSVAAAMESAGMLATAEARALGQRWCFGQLIGNTDMHLANASVWFDDSEPFAVAPAYDMLPMVFAPGAQGEIVPREFVFTPPLPRLRPDWNVARPWALEFWQRVESDALISEPFRQLAANAGAAVARLES
jgi:hypothetical protein